MSMPATGAPKTAVVSSLDLGEFLLLGALWGSSFLFMRVAAPEFGPVPLIAVRVVLAACLMLPLLFWAKAGAPIQRAQFGPLILVGLLNSALPFCLFAYAALKLPAGISAVLNATAALWGPLIGWLVYRQALSRRSVYGLLVGFFGVVVMVGAQTRQPDPTASSALEELLLPIGAALLATACYGFSGNFTRVQLQNVGPLRVAAGSQLAAACALLPIGVAAWPAQPPSGAAWLAAVTLGVACTALAYALYFRLIARLGAARAILVTLLIPVFGVVLGVIFLGESFSFVGLLGASFVLIGTAIAIGVRVPIR